MKKLFVCIVLFLSLKFSGNAQFTNKTPPELAERQTQGMAKLLKLDSIQLNMLLPIMYGHYRKIDSVKMLFISEEQKSTQIKYLNTQQLEKIQNLLNRAQFAQYQQILIDTKRRTLREAI